MANGGRKVDVFAKPESLADKLRKRRKAYESGDVEEMQKVNEEMSKPKKKNSNDK